MISRTKDEILNALNRLLTQYPIEEIKVSMIIENANIGKSTFYRYFNDKFDVMNYNYDLILQESINNSSDLKELLHQILQQFQKFNMLQMKRFHNYKGQNSINDYIFNRSVLFLEMLARQNRNGKGLTEEERFQCMIICGGISVLGQQIQEKAATTASGTDYAELLFDLFPASVKALDFDVNKKPAILQCL